MPDSGIHLEMLGLHESLPTLVSRRFDQARTEEHLTLSATQLVILYNPPLPDVGDAHDHASIY